jgi:hypothetical protein
MMLPPWGCCCRPRLTSRSWRLRLIQLWKPSCDNAAGRRWREGAFKTGRLQRTQVQCFSHQPAVRHHAQRQLLLVLVTGASRCLQVACRPAAAGSWLRPGTTWDRGAINW